LRVLFTENRKEPIAARNNETDRGMKLFDRLIPAYSLCCT